MSMLLYTVEEYYVEADKLKIHKHAKTVLVTKLMNYYPTVDQNILTWAVLFLIEDNFLEAALLLVLLVNTSTESRERDIIEMKKCF